MTERFLYDGSRCDCGAVFITTVERCSHCGRWDPAPAEVEAGGVLIATTQVTGDDGQPRSFGMVELDCGLRVIGLTEGDPPIGTEVVAWSGSARVARYVPATPARQLSRNAAVAG